MLSFHWVSVLSEKCQKYEVVIVEENCVDQTNGLLIKNCNISNFCLTEGKCSVLLISKRVPKVTGKVSVFKDHGKKIKAGFREYSQTSVTPSL